MEGFEGLIRRVAQARVEFVIVGGYAAVFHGSTLLTHDVDICCPMNAATLLRIQAALKDLHPKLRVPARPPLSLTSKSAKGFKNLHLDTDWGPLDCLGEIRGIGRFAAVKKCSVSIDLDGLRCRILNLDALIEAKKTMGREKDSQAILELEVLREKLKKR